MMIPENDSPAKYFIVFFSKLPNKSRRKKLNERYGLKSLCHTKQSSVNSENSELPDASKTVKMAETVT
jgi:hypothetical protein